MTEAFVETFHDDEVIEQVRAIGTSALCDMVHAEKSRVARKRLQEVELPPEMQPEAVDLVGNRLRALYRNRSEEAFRKGISYFGHMALQQGQYEVVKRAIGKLVDSSDERTKRSGYSLTRNFVNHLSKNERQ